MLSFLKRKKWWVVVILVVIVAGLWWQRSRSRGEEGEYALVERKTIVSELVLSGEVEAADRATLKFQSGGKLVWLGVAEGDVVEKGQALARLDTVNLNADLARAWSDLRQAEATVERVHDEVKDNDEDEDFETKEQRTIAEVAKDKAWDAVLKAQQNLRHATLVSPIAGRVIEIALPPVGSNITVTDGIEVVDLETVYFSVAADQTEIVDMYVDQPVEMVLDAWLDEVIEGRIERLAVTPKAGEVGTVYEVKVDFQPSEDEASDSAESVLSVNGLPSQLRLGMTGDAEFVLDRKEDVLAVAIQYVQSDDEGDYVMASVDVDGAEQRKVYVEMGLESETEVEIVGEVEEGERVYN